MVLNSESELKPPPLAAANPASPLASTVRTCPLVAVESLTTKLRPGILNLVIFVSPKVISFETSTALGVAESPIQIFLEPVVNVSPA